MQKITNLASDKNGNTSVHKTAWEYIKPICKKIGGSL